MKKISILWTLSAFTFLSFSVSAEVVTNTNCGSNCSWSYDTDTGEVNVFLTNTSGDNPTGTVSSTPWTTAYGTSITKITTTDSLSGNVKCNSCSNLTEVVLGKDITSISSDAFSGTQLAHITIPSDSKITSIGDRAFQNTNLESITIPNSVKTINSNAFNGTRLTSLVIPDSVTSGSIGCNNCANLTEIVIGKNVTSIASDAFRGTQLTSIVIPADSKLTTNGDRAFWGTNIDSITIPNSITTINSNAFYGVSLSKIECNEENLARYLAKGGTFKEGATISCSRGSCENALKGTKWEGKVGVIYPTQEKPLANGGVAVFKNGEFVGYKGKRIYTVDEVNTVVGAKNKVVIRYR